MTTERLEEAGERGRRTPRDLFAAEPDRLSGLAIEERGIRFDFSKTHLSRALVESFLALAEAGRARRRAATRCSRARSSIRPRAAPPSMAPSAAQGAPDSVARAAAFHARMRALVDAIEAEAFGPIRHILHIGIGGSALGPKLLIDALGRTPGRYEAAIVSNVDGAALEEAIAGFDPHATLIAIASKTFTTTETMLNAALGAAMAGGSGGRGSLRPGRRAHRRARQGDRVRGRRDPDPALRRDASAAAIRSGRRSAFRRRWRSAGTRSKACSRARPRWTAISGSRRSRRTRRCSPPSSTAITPMSAAPGRRAVFAYDERVRLLPSYLQQLEMESNGKSVRLDGSPVGRATSPIVWGGVGTDAQHAVFQLLHQGTHLIPAEFVAVIEPEHGLDRGASRPIADQLLRTRGGADGRPRVGRSASRLSRRPAIDDDPARPARSRRSARCSLSTSTGPSPMPPARHQPVRPVRSRARQGNGEAGRRAGRSGLRPVDPGPARARFRR